MKQFLRDCVSWPLSEVNDLNDMIEQNRQISLRTFRKHVDREQLDMIERQLGYVTRPWEKGLRMCNDHHVSYHASQLNSSPVVYIRHSAIEYVFA